MRTAAFLLSFLAATSGASAAVLEYHLRDEQGAVLGTVDLQLSNLTLLKPPLVSFSETRPARLSVDVDRAAISLSALKGSYRESGSSVPLLVESVFEQNPAILSCMTQPDGSGHCLGRRNGGQFLAADGYLDALSQISAVPLPGAFGLAALGLGVLGALRLRKRH